MFGVGAAKAGTSWLYRYLSDHPDCQFKAIKELHYFNSIDEGRLDAVRQRTVELRDRIAAEAARDIGPRKLANKVRNLAHVEHYLEVLDRGIEDLDAYRDYLFAGAGDAKLVGELTPAYAMLTPDRLGKMAKLTKDVRFVYLLRDPVDRLWSHVRMIASQRSSDTLNFSERAGNILARVLRGDEEQIARRSDYAGPLAALSSAVHPDKVMFGVFEDFFSGDLVVRLCEFLGIRYVKPNLEKVVNEGTPLDMRPEQRAAAADWLAPQYDAVYDRFGALPTAWQANLARVS